MTSFEQGERIAGGERKKVSETEKEAGQANIVKGER